MLIKQGFKGNIIATQATAEFAGLNLPDAAYLNALEIERVNKKRPKNKLKPIYTMEEADSCIDLIRCYDYNREIKLSEKTSIELLRAGHMLGAAMVKITYRDGYNVKRILFTGDTSGKYNNHPYLTIADDIGKVDAIVTESTYGNRLHNRQNHIEKLKQCIQETCIDKKRTLLIAVFSLQRSTEILHWLRDVYLENPEFEKIPIYLDSPMSIDAQEVVRTNEEYWGKKWLTKEEKIGSLWDWDKVVYVVKAEKSKRLSSDGSPKILISSAGMLNGGRIQHHLQTFLPSKGCKLLLTGFVAEGTLGYKLLNSKQKTISICGKQVRINAKIDRIEGYSSHADKKELIELLNTCEKKKLKKIIVNHGNVECSKEFTKVLQSEFPNTEVIFPQYKQIIKI